MNQESVFIQATAVSINGGGVLIMGPSGVGKTTLALQLIELGAILISDDGVHVCLEKGSLICNPPSVTVGKAEIRGLGIVSGIPVQSAVPVLCMVRLHSNDVERCPLTEIYESILGQKVRVFDFFSCTNTYLNVIYAVKVMRGELALFKG